MALTVQERNETATAPLRPADRQASLVQGGAVDLLEGWQELFYARAMEASSEWVYSSILEDAAVVFRAYAPALSPEIRRCLATFATGPQLRSVETAAEVGTYLLMSPAHERLTQIARLEPDWDSYGAEPPSPTAVSNASRLLKSVRDSLGGLLGEQIRPYSVAPVSDGGIQVEWRSSEQALEVEVGPQGDLGYLLADGLGPNRTFEEADEVSSSEVLRLVARVLLS